MGEQGSSPRMRGARGAGPPHRVRGGIIPAYAGSTPTTWPWATRWRDHPRVCGEHSATLLPMLLIVGSSPRMRGAPSTLLRGSAALGIIPAYAGSTGNTVVQGYIDGDHPRVCGEHRSLSARPTDTWGSSPRMRGALVLHPPAPALRGIIPAYAGSTDTLVFAQKPLGDHPRVCGEHFSHIWTNHFNTGSSPRMRGALFLSAHGRYASGIIPAYAGSTTHCTPRCQIARDHPRVCGEH